MISPAERDRRRTTRGTRREMSIPQYIPDDLRNCDYKLDVLCLIWDLLGDCVVVYYMHAGSLCIVCNGCFCVPTNQSTEFAEESVL